MRSSAPNIQPQETKARRTPCHTLSPAPQRPHGQAQARGTLCPRTPAAPQHNTGTLAEAVPQHTGRAPAQHGDSSTTWGLTHNMGTHAEVVPTDTGRAPAQHGYSSTGGAPAHCQCPRTTRGLTQRRCPSTQAMPRQKNRGQAPRATAYPAEQARAGDGFQRPLVPRSRFQPRLTRGVRCPFC